MSWLPPMNAPLLSDINLYFVKQHYLAAMESNGYTKKCPLERKSVFLFQRYLVGFEHTTLSSFTRSCISSFPPPMLVRLFVSSCKLVIVNGVVLFAKINRVNIVRYFCSYLNHICLAIKSMTNGKAALCTKNIMTSRHKTQNVAYHRPMMIF